MINISHSVGRECYKRVIVAGAGTLGSAVLCALGEKQFRSVLVVDPDFVELRNLTGSDLLQDRTTVGRSKVACVLETLHNRYPNTEWSGFQGEIADVDATEFEQADLLFGCVDTDLARIEMAALAARFEISVCDGGLGGATTNVGRVSWFPRGSAACFSCLLGTRRRASLLTYGEAMVHRCQTEEMFLHDGWQTSALTARRVGRLQVDSALYKENRDAAYTQTLYLESNEYSVTVLHEVSALCPFHEQEVCKLISFPIADKVGCRECGCRFRSGRRIAWVRRWGICPGCGSKNLVICSAKRDLGVPGWKEQGAATV